MCIFNLLNHTLSSLRFVFTPVCDGGARIYFPPSSICSCSRTRRQKWKNLQASTNGQLPLFLVSTWKSPVVFFFAVFSKVEQLTSKKCFNVTERKIKFNNLATKKASFRHPTSFLNFISSFFFTVNPSGWFPVINILAHLCLGPAIGKFI